ncbi:MAG TPA: hypothetical protein VK212_11195 [Lentimicrobium sp.]|nr:hypothetical protein [Lentimicrobium sp.]
MKLSAFLILFLITLHTFGQAHDSLSRSKDTLSFKGQLSSFILFNKEGYSPLAGIRYIPQFNYGITTANKRLWDTELSLNMFGNAGLGDPDSYITDADVKLYRGWVRYSGEQFEIRLGLQKINFGSASILRPLMWFDRLDPRDPLQLTYGVWGLLARYYFLNNVNLWAWTLYGNEKPSVWEVVETNEHIPEFGGRIQFPVSKGELGFTYHHRNADSRHLMDVLYPNSQPFERIPENKVGIDGKWDMTVGLWFEASFSKKQKDTNPFTNQQLLNIGADYTFGIGNGLNTAVEHLIASDSERWLNFNGAYNFSALSLSYPLGINDNISAIVYHDWENDNFYTFFNWKKQLNDFAIYAIFFSNPETNLIPVASDTFNVMGGTGIQLMVVYNH